MALLTGPCRAGTPGVCTAWRWGALAPRAGIPPLPAPSPTGWPGKPAVGMLANRRGQLRTSENSGKGGRILRAVCPKVAVRAGCHRPCWKGRSQSLCRKGGQGPPGWLQPMLQGAKPSWQSARGGVRLGSGEVLARAEGEHCARAVPSCTARRSCKGCSGGATRQGLALP